MLSEDRLLPPSAVPHRVVWERPVLALGLRTVGEVLKSVQLGSRHGAGPGGRVLATESRQLRCSSAPSYRTLIWLTRASYVQLDNAEALEYGQHQGTIRSRSLCDGNFGDPAYRSKNLQIKKREKKMSWLAVSAAVDAQDCFGGPHQSCRKHSTVVWPSASWFTAARRTRPSSVGPAGGVQTGLALWSPVDRDFRRSGDLLRSLNAVQQWTLTKASRCFGAASQTRARTSPHQRRIDGAATAHRQRVGCRLRSSVRRAVVRRE
jgi:hypothetical protein